jgi:dihydropteroate synthase
VAFASTRNERLKTGCAGSEAPTSSCRRRVDPPGAEELPVDEELRRVLRVVERLAASGLTVSIDTYKATVAREAVAHGACIVNDISGFLFDRDQRSWPKPARRSCSCTIAGAHATCPQAVYQNVGADVRRELHEAMSGAGRGVPRVHRRPGLGFAKRAEHSFAALASLDLLRGSTVPSCAALHGNRF